MLPDIVGTFLSDSKNSDIWVTCEAKGNAVCFCYAVPEELTKGAWNMLATAVQPAEQGNGFGAAIAKHLEAELKKRGQRILIADTSSSDEFAQTREFYRKNGYSE